MQALLLVDLRYDLFSSTLWRVFGLYCAHTTVTSQRTITLTLTQTIKKVLNLGPEFITLILHVQICAKERRLFAGLVLTLGILESGPTLTLAYEI